MTRRGKTMWPTLALVSIFLVAGYGYYMYNEVSHRLRLSETRIEKFEKRHSSMKSQLQVVYEHRAKLEGTLTKERQDHILAKQDLLSKIKEYEANVTRTRHEAFNRFNALDTQHKMLKVQYDDLVADHSRMEQQYVRLGDDHRVVVADLKEDYQKLKEAKEKESKALQDRVQELYNENEVMRSDMTHQRQSLSEEKRSAELCLEDLKKAQSEKKVLSDTVNELNQKIVTLKKALRTKLVRERRKDKAVAFSLPTKRTALASTARTPTSLPKERKSPIENAAPAAGIIKRHKQRLGELKGSNLRMRHLIIRNNAMKEEDSIKDQYEKAPTEVPTEEDIDEPERQVDKRETEFQKLVEKRGIFNGNFDASDQTRKQDPKSLTDLKRSVDAKGNPDKTTVSGKAAAKSEDTSGVKENEALKFDGRSEPSAEKKELKAEEDAGKDFMKKQLHLRLQERLQSKDVVSLDKNLNKGVLNLQNIDPLPTTKRSQQINHGGLRPSKEVMVKRDQKIKNPVFNNRRQLQPPKVKSSPVKEDDVAAMEKPESELKTEAKEKEELIVEKEVKSSDQNNPVASPIKDKKAIGFPQHKPDQAKRDSLGVDTGRTANMNGADRSSSLKDNVHLKASSLESDRSDKYSEHKDSGKFEKQNAAAPHKAVPLPKANLIVKEVAKSNPPGHATQVLKESSPTLSPVTVQDVKAFSKAQSVVNGEKRSKVVSESNAEAAVKNKELSNEPDEEDDADGNELEGDTVENAKIETGVESPVSKEENVKGAMEKVVKDVPIGKPAADPKETEELEDDDNSDQLADERSNEGVDEVPFNGNREANIKKVAAKGEENPELKDAKVLAGEKRRQEDMNEQETLAQNDGNELDDEDRDGVEPHENGENNI